MATETADLQGAIERNPAWYHTIELAPGVATPGWFDLRPVVEKMPWPDVRGKRCLDIGTYDGFLAFELERRGASEVVAVDVADPRDWDWPADARHHGPERAAEWVGEDKGIGFRIAKEALGSSAERREMTIYQLSPDSVGTFDVVVCGSLMLHLRDPIGALEAVRSVCTGHFLSAEQVRLGLTALHRRRALAELNGSGTMVQWWVPNAAGHRRMLYAAGFEIERHTRPYAIPYGESHHMAKRGAFSALKDRVQQGLLAGGVGVPTVAVLARPRL